MRPKNRTHCRADTRAARRGPRALFRMALGLAPAPERKLVSGTGIRATGPFSGRIVPLGMPSFPGALFLPGPLLVAG